MEGNVLYNWHKMTTDLTDKLWDKALPFVAKSQHRLENISHECAGSLFKIMMGLRKQETWAVIDDIVDSMGSIIPSGFLEGTVTSFGNVDECTVISVPDDGYDEPFHGKYCLLYLRPELPPKSGLVKHSDHLFNLSGTTAEGTVFEHLSERFSGIYSVGAIRVGVCVPSNCQKDEIKPLLSQTYQMDADLSEKCLSNHDSNGLSIHQKIIFHFRRHEILLSLMTLLVVMSSVSHYLLNGSVSGKCLKSLHCWSLFRNYDQLMATSAKENRRMAAVHGIRVLTIIWTTINHTYTFGENLSQVRKVPESFMFQLVFNAWALVETFFFLSGLLVVYITLPMLHKTKGNLNVVLFIFHRLIRIIPSVCGIIAVNFLWPLFSTDL
ncbi:unnamed protein product [Medioppia subpectinata]|uniref:Nose resistant-to-fluoxetine protein N-terminal domain-containing protein n=1 Tax=Medioppia subpectinata TaxID=1979941 RepID=A0A7R9L7L8_9ACAR|nr:unnamed protein product [Medioppia subpectinata]CAG2116670.1 unnamed protein product [Medioppia subpectinata]